MNASRARRVVTSETSMFDTDNGSLRAPDDCHGEPFGFAQDRLREESLIAFCIECPEYPEMFRYAQHDSVMLDMRSVLAPARSPAAIQPFFPDG